MARALVLVLVAVSCLALFAPRVPLASAPVVPVPSEPIIVDTTADPGSPGVCALRDAITAASTHFAVNGCTAGGGLDTIIFRVTGTITLRSPLPPVANGSTGFLKINGSGQTISGAGTYQVLTVNPGATLSLNNLTIANGNAASGGGVHNEGTLTVTNTTFSRNQATNGGAIYNQGSLVIVNSTFSRNTAASNGGAIANAGTLKLIHGTFANNSALVGAGVYNRGTASVSNSILADEVTGGNCSGPIANGGYNIANDGTCAFGATSIAANGAPIGDDVNPLLDPVGLQNNGGATATIALEATSPAIGAVALAACTVPTDQRGASRPAPGKNGCDIGATEYGGVVPAPAGSTSKALATLATSAATVGNDGLPPMPDSLFNCFAQAQFTLVNGIIWNTVWPNSCFNSVAGLVPNMDRTYVYNWQQLFPLFNTQPSAADDYLAYGWDAHCANCFPEYSQDYPYTFVYKAPVASSSATPTSTFGATPTPTPVSGSSCAGVSCPYYSGMAMSCYVINNTPECCVNGYCTAATSSGPPNPTATATATPTPTSGSTGPMPTATPTFTLGATPTPTPVTGGSSCSGVSCPYYSGMAMGCYVINNTPECCVNGYCAPAASP